MKSSDTINKIPVSILKKWGNIQSRGDVKKIILLTGLSKPTVIKALKHGIAPPELILTISEYFSKKKENLAQVKEESLNILNQ